MNKLYQSDKASAVHLFALSFTALFLELMMIRWTPTVVRFVAYYGNLMLISSFLGLGLGAMISRRRRWIGWFPLILAVTVLLMAMFHAQLTAPASATEARFGQNAPVWLNYIALVSVFVFNTIMFVPLGQEIGLLFTLRPPLQAYALDLGGSLCGTIIFGVFSFYRFSPLWGLMIVAVVLLAVVGRRLALWNAPLWALVLLIVWRTSNPVAIWSPYYYITMHNGPDAEAVADPVPNLRTRMDPPIYQAHVNTDFYQAHGTIDPARYTPGTKDEQRVRNVFIPQYMLPYQLHPHPNRVCVVGAGGGMDVEAALRAGAQEVDAVEIDPVLVQLAHRFAASGVYDDPRVHVQIDDGRAFLQADRKHYDVVIFGFLDSQALFSASSNIRLDGFIYTVQSMRRAYSMLEPDGLLSVSFFAARPWIVDKLRDMLAEATGRTPIVYHLSGQYILEVPRGASPPTPANLATFTLETKAAAAVDLPTDDWPFLYLSRRTVPEDYSIVILTLVLFSLVAVGLAQRTGQAGHKQRLGAAQGHFFFLGLGFLLLETQSIGDCSLYFGVTWLVTLIVVCGVLLMVLAANLLAMRLTTPRLAYYFPLLASVALLYFMPRDWVLAWPRAARLAWSLLCVPLPIFFAGLIFSTTFRQATDPARLLAANLLGATLGGFCEYLGMAIGARALLLIVMAAYIASLICRLQNKKTPISQNITPQDEAKPTTRLAA